MGTQQNKLDTLFSAKADFIRNREHLPAELVDLLEQVRRLQRSAMDHVSVAIPATEELAAREENLMGKPLLARESFPYDLANAEALMHEVIALLKQGNGPMSQAAQILEEALTSGALQADDLYTRFLSDDVQFFDQWAEKTPEAPRALAFLAKSSLEPSLRFVAEALAPHASVTESPRAHGSCPICGSLPLISRLEGKEGFRFATCSHCLHEYRVQRIACLFCDETDHEKLTFFTVQEEPGYRVDVCKSCGNYLKTIDFRQLDRKTLPILDDLDSLALDFVARENGYHRATLSAWGF